MGVSLANPFLLFEFPEQATPLGTSWPYGTRFRQAALSACCGFVSIWSTCGHKLDVAKHSGFASILCTCGHKLDALKHSGLHQIEP